MTLPGFESRRFGPPTRCVLWVGRSHSGPSGAQRRGIFGAIGQTHPSSLVRRRQWCARCSCSGVQELVPPLWFTGHFQCGAKPVASVGQAPDNQCNATCQDQQCYFWNVGCCVSAPKRCAQVRLSDMIVCNPRKVPLEDGILCRGLCFELSSGIGCWCWLNIVCNERWHSLQVPRANCVRHLEGSIDMGTGEINQCHRSLASDCRHCFPFLVQRSVPVHCCPGSY